MTIRIAGPLRAEHDVGSNQRANTKHHPGNRPANSPTHLLPQLALHNLPHPPLNQHPRLQTPPLRSPAPLLRLRGLPRPARARIRPRLHPSATRESLPQPLRRWRDRGETEGAGEVPTDRGGSSAVADRQQGAGRVCARSELGSECVVGKLAPFLLPPCPFRHNVWWCALLISGCRMVYE